MHVVRPGPVQGAGWRASKQRRRHTGGMELKRVDGKTKNGSTAIAAAETACFPTKDNAKE